MNNTTSNRTVIEAFEAEFRRYRRLAEEAIAQVSDLDLYAQLNPAQNSISVIIQHMHGNMMSRWTDFLTTDGEKPTRDRDAEFVERGLARDELIELWRCGWDRVFNALTSLTDADMNRVVTIRNEPHTVARAIARQAAHYAWHAGQIALIAKHLVGEKWKYLTIPPGESYAFSWWVER